MPGQLGNRGGQSWNDRKLAAEVRTLSLKKVKAILEGEENDFQKAILLKLAGTILPRLNEHTGEDGKELPTPILNNYVQCHNSNSENNANAKETALRTGGNVGQQDSVHSPILNTLEPVRPTASLN